ncbi:TerB family tellurite resistance protein [Devosia sp. XJ19-1]|uniref:TerB family tellurite resistance protein n=1 Tax=Devosia ureilytica TaxID=2952754 RepID=A0A9Q4AQV6_9HYPH|nr:TerB family tellurite resistance protein [Devosia ureilytica]MCP8885432.1 TerB family tellurite resistance protein [Devosia ureilytica]MCP8888101.1 TerB family tellurite resistance protein [Devosia ureilytica]
MSKDKNTDKDLFLRGARLRARQDANTREMHDDASRATTEEFFQALVAAVAVIAHSDGRLDLAERRTLVEAFITSPAMAGFSVAQLAQELAEHSRAFGYDPHSADQRALASLSASKLSGEERQSLLQICHQVITADSMVHPVELGALHRVERALGLAGGSL